MTATVWVRPPWLERPLANVPLVGRRSECALLDGLVDAVRAGQSRALVVSGEPGIGKTALLHYLVGRAAGCRVVHATGAQSERELAFAGLHQLSGPLLDRLERLPGPQHDALAAAFGLSAGPAPDRFLVGLGLRGLLAEAAAARPLVCVVDNAQWWDRESAQALAFAGRRLGAEAVAVVVVVRDCDDVPELTGLPQLRVEGLPDAEARTLLCSALAGPVDERVLDRIIAEAGGNPLALTEPPHRLMSLELSGGFAPVGTRELPGRVEESCRIRLARLPAETRALMVVAAAEPLGDPVLVWRAAELLGLGIQALPPAAALLDIGDRVKFRQPLLRSTVYQTASAEERRAAHRALAEATDSQADPDRRAWHAAHAVAEPDEHVASELENLAGRARARGGWAATAAFLQRAAELTPDPGRRASRALAAAQAMHQAGVPDAALRLLSLAEAGPLDELRSALADQLRAQIAFAVNRGGDAVPLLLTAVERLEPLDAGLARESALDALSAAMFAGPLDDRTAVRRAAQVARTMPPLSQPPRAADRLLDGLAVRFTDGYAAGVPAARQALELFGSPDLPEDEGLRWLWLAHVAAVDVWDDESVEVLSDRHVRFARDAGALTALPLALSMRVGAHVFVGELAEAASLVKETEAASEATGSHVAPYGALLLAAWQGREAEADQLIGITRADVERRGEGIGSAFISWAEAVLYDGLGRYEDAMSSALQAVDHPQELGAPTWGALVELVEAATRTGRVDRGAEALQRLTEMTRAGGSDWALGLEARCRALLTEDADDLYQEAIERLDRTRIRGELARAHLLYGEWLRRVRRRMDAREQLRTAHEIFIAIGAEAFADRAARELRATGETARRRGVVAGGELTAQEAQIARLACQRLSNPEIAARLFLSTRTVEWHLSKIFAKLNITSRRQLPTVPDEERESA